MIDFELSFSVADVSGVDQAQNELFDRVYRAAAAAGAKFSPRLSGSPRKATAEDKAESGIPERLLAGISTFLDLDCEGKCSTGVADAAKGLQAGRSDREAWHDLASLVHRQLRRSGWVGGGEWPLDRGHPIGAGRLFRRTRTAHR